MRNFLIGVFIFWLAIVGLIIRHERQSVAGSDEMVMTDRVEVVFWHAMGGPLGKVMDDMIKDYNMSQNKYFVKSVNMGSYNTLSQKILASLVAGKAPDISQNFEALTLKFIRHGKIVCLDDLIASETEDIKSDIIPVLLENNTFDGKLYSFPFNKSVPVLYYNKDMFAKVGLDPERPPQTLDELASFSRIITEFHKNIGLDHVYGYGLSKANVWAFLNKIIQFGGEIVSADNKESMFDQEAALNALTFMQNMLKEGIAKEGQAFDHQNEFIAGSVGIIESSIVSKVYMQGSLRERFNFGVAPLPGQVRKGAVLSGTNINIINNGSPQKIAGAWDFIKWFTNTENGARWSIGTTYLPVRISSLNSKAFTQAKERDSNIEAPYVQLDYCYFEPRISAWAEIRDLVADHLERASIEKGPPETYCRAMKQDADAILRHATK